MKDSKSVKNTKILRNPAMTEDIPEQGRGGLRKSILIATLMPMIVVAILLVIVGGVSYSRSLQEQMSVGLSDIAQSVLAFYDETCPGDYNLMIDNDNNRTYLYKGDVCISDDTSYIDEISERTGAEITLFFYDTRMMTTIEEDGKDIVNTIANSNIVDKVLTGQQASFFNGAEIAGTRYCAEYIPIFGSDGTCIAMIGVCKPYVQISKYVDRILYITGAVMILALAFMGFSMVKYIDGLVKALNYIREFLKKIAEGDLDTQLNMKVFSREDEIGDMGRLANYLRSSLKKLIEKDPLTKLNNRRSGITKIKQIRARAEMNSSPYAVALGDIDFFKKVNDTYGHDAGDEVLKAVSLILSRSVTGHGTVVRWGGEEFLIVFDGDDEQSAAGKLNAVLDEIRSTTVHYGESDINFTMSFGVIEGDTDRTYENDVTLADQRLYYAKEHGRNRVVTGMEYKKEESE